LHPKGGCPGRQVSVWENNEKRENPKNQQDAKKPITIPAQRREKVSPVIVSNGEKAPERPEETGKHTPRVEKGMEGSQGCLNEKENLLSKGNKGPSSAGASFSGRSNYPRSVQLMQTQGLKSSANHEIKTV